MNSKLIQQQKDLTGVSTRLYENVLKVQQNPLDSEKPSIRNNLII